ncbi:MAG: c-type cytochrome [Phycisphaerae bacterium]
MTSQPQMLRIGRWAMGLIGLFVASAGVIAPLTSHEMTTIAVHHLLHAGMAVGAALLAIAVAPPKRQAHERSAWLWLAIVAPAIGLLLMWPSEYAYLMSHRWLHFLDHLSIAAVTFLAVYASQAYVAGLGWLMAALVVAMDAACAGGFGVSPGPSFLLTPKPALAASASGQAAASTTAARPATLHALGAKLYFTMGCNGCHSVDGSPMLGPSWKNLAGYPQKLANGKSSVADYAFLRSMILNPGKFKLAGYPAGVMPSTYRAQLSGPKHPHEVQLNAIIWYINSLSDRADKRSEPPVADRFPK